MNRPIVAIIGTADASADLADHAFEVGTLIAKAGFTLVTGGLTGVMEAASRGAHEAGGVVVGILPGPHAEEANPFVTIPIVTNMGHARNCIIAHTADMLIAVGGGFGTLSEIAVARKLGKPVFAISSWEIADAHPVANAAEAIEACQRWLDDLIFPPENRGN